MDQKNLLNFSIKAQVSELEIYISCGNEQTKKKSQEILNYYKIKETGLKNNLEELKNMNDFLYKKLDYIRNKR
jgi:hypothetical protein